MDRAIGVVLSIPLAVVFLVAAVPKLRQPRHFLFTVLTYDVLPDSLARVYAVLIPPLELLVAVLLVSGVAVRTAVALVASMLVTFIVAISVNLARGRRLECECFGRVRQRSIGWSTVLEDVLLLVAACVILGTTSSWWGTESWSVFILIGSHLMPSASLLSLQHSVVAGDFGTLVICVGIAATAIAALRRGRFMAATEQGAGAQGVAPPTARQAG